MSKYYLFALPLLFSLLSPAHAIAAGASTCQPLFGGGTTCQQNSQITIDKQVKNPATGIYVDGLGANNPRYYPGMEVPFKLVVKNTSSIHLTNITVTDSLPQFIEYAAGAGTFDWKTNTLTTTLSALAPGQEDVIFLQGKVVSKSALPTNKDIVCVANQAAVSTGNNHSQDNTQFCIQKNPPAPASVTQGQNPAILNTPTTKGGFAVFTPTQTRRTPSTGPEAWEVIALLPTGAIGYWLRRKTGRN